MRRITPAVAVALVIGVTLPCSAQAVSSHATQCSGLLGSIDRLAATVRDLAETDPAEIRVTDGAYEALGQLARGWRVITRQKIITDVADWKGGRLLHIWQISSQMTDRAMRDVRPGHARDLSIAFMAFLLQLEVAHEILCALPDGARHGGAARLKEIVEDFKKAQPLRPQSRTGFHDAEPPALLADKITPLLPDDAVKIMRTYPPPQD